MPKPNLTNKLRYAEDLQEIITDDGTSEPVARLIGKNGLGAVDRTDMTPKMRRRAYAMAAGPKMEVTMRDLIRRLDGLCLTKRLPEAQAALGILRDLDRQR